MPLSGFEKTQISSNISELIATPDIDAVITTIRSCVFSGHGRSCEHDTVVEALTRILAVDENFRHVFEDLLIEVRSEILNRNHDDPNTKIASLSLSIFESRFSETLNKVARGESKFRDSLMALLLLLSSNEETLSRFSEESTIDSINQMVAHSIDAVSALITNSSSPFVIASNRREDLYFLDSIKNVLLADEMTVLLASPSFEGPIVTELETEANEIHGGIRLSALLIPIEISLTRHGTLVILSQVEISDSSEIRRVASAIKVGIERVFRLLRERQGSVRLSKLQEIREKTLQSDSTDFVDLAREISIDLYREQMIFGSAIIRYSIDQNNTFSFSITDLYDPEGLFVGVENWRAEIAFDMNSPLIAAIVEASPKVTPGLPVASSKIVGIDSQTDQLLQSTSAVRIPLHGGDSHSGYVSFTFVTDNEAELLDSSFLGQFDDLMNLAVSRAQNNITRQQSHWIAQLNETLLNATSSSITASSETKLLSAICNALLTPGRFRAAFYVKPSQSTQLLQPVSAAGVELQALARNRVPLYETPKQTLAQIAFTSGEMTIQNRLTDYAEAHLHSNFVEANGWRSAIAVPIKRESSSQVQGVLVVTSTEEDVFQGSVIKVIKTVSLLVEHMLSEIALKKALREEKSRLTEIVSRDYLTDIYNRRAFEREVARVMRLHQTGIMALGILDLDGFKLLNDSKGHRVGDNLLRSLAKSMSSSLREREFMARLGGDEFGFLIHLDDLSELDLFVERMNRCFKRQRQEIKVTGSFGWSFFPLDGTTYDSLILKADEALYAAKAIGGGRSMIFAGEVAERVSRRSTIRDDLEGALLSGEATFYCQPKVDLSIKKVVGLEMLIRWPEVETQVLIDEIRSNRHISHLVGRHLIHHAAKTRAILDAEQLNEVTVALNISPNHFTDPIFIEELSPLLPRSNAFILEITEDVAIDANEQVRKQINEVKRLGFKISIDDFGSGYTSLRAVSQLEVDEIKVDRSFLYGLDINPNSYAVFSSIIHLGKMANAKVVAEGIETEEQEALWTSLGGTIAQGYRYSKALPIPEISNWILTYNNQ
ncbi:MAG: EAL domain-containing protein [Actinomycetota bacterium]|nr:EAL domain-containing protein [Actinomycetota bacterium]